MINIGLLQIVLSSLCLAIMSFIIKDLNEIPASNLLFYRALIQTIISLIYACYLKLNPFGSSSVYFLLNLRGLAGGVAVYLYFQTLKQIPVSTATALFMTSPIYSIILARIFLQERVSYAKTFAVIVVLLGSALIAHPNSWVESYSDFLGSSLAVTEAFMAAVAVTFIKLIGDRAHFVQLVFYLSIYMLLIGIILSLKDGLMLVWNLKIVSIGLLATAGQLLVNAGLQKVGAVIGVTVRSSEVLFAFLIGIFLGEEIPLLSIYGSFLIVVGGWLLGKKNTIKVEDSYEKQDDEEEEVGKTGKRKSFNETDA
eukprot:NODE_39_length_35218_cov_0.479655.p13 type:complete len:311 gc:universal NODE_39_length_35218_cov_0.479655:1981-1049(-)